MALLHFEPGDALKIGKAYSQIPIDRTGDYALSRAGEGTYIDSSGVSQTAAANVPRFDYSTGGSCPTLLVEPQRTNLFLYNNDFTQSTWAKLSSTITVNSATSIDGTANMSLLSLTADNGSLAITVNYSSAGTYTQSVYCRPGNTTKIRLRAVNYGTEDYLCIFDMTGVGSVVSGDNGTAQIKNIGGGIYRVSISHSPSTYLTGTLHIYPINADNTPNLGDTIYISHAMLEDGSGTTSVINTTSATVTRPADVYTVTPPAGTTSIIETIDGVDQPPITTIPATHQISEGNINKVIMT